MHLALRPVLDSRAHRKPIARTILEATGISGGFIVHLGCGGGRLLVLDDQRAYGFRADNLGNTLLPTPGYRLYAADKGEKLAEYNLDGLPVFDGMIAASGRLFISTQDGRLLSLAAAK